VSAPPLVIVPVDSLDAVPSIDGAGEPTTVMMLAEQRPQTLDGARKTQLVELFECSKW
jgi:hypothetical protein